MCGGLECYGEDDHGGGLVGHRLSKYDGKDEKCRQQPNRVGMAGEEDQQFCQVFCRAGHFHGGPQPQHAADQDQYLPLDDAIGLLGLEAARQENGNHTNQHGDG